VVEISLRDDRRNYARDTGRLTAGSGISHPVLSQPGHGTGTRWDGAWKLYSGMGPG
jgi:hypothetical protein